MASVCDDAPVIDVAVLAADGGITPRTGVGTRASAGTETTTVRSSDVPGVNRSTLVVVAVLAILVGTAAAAVGAVSFALVALVTALWCFLVAGFGSTSAESDGDAATGSDAAGADADDRGAPELDHCARCGRAIDGDADHCRDCTIAGSWRK